MSEPGAARAVRTPRRASLWVTSLHTGGCSACAQSLAALEAPRYAKQLAALGVSFIRSPRQSDVILLCGALTEKARLSVSRVLEGTPRPRALVAVGDCAINGCVFAGSPSLITPLAQTLNMNVEIGGCPPTPEAIIAAVSEAGRLLSAGVAAGDPVAPTILPPTPSAPSVPLSARDRAARVAALIEAASDGWSGDDEDEGDDEAPDDEAPPEPPDQATSMNATESTTKAAEIDHLTGNGASAPQARQQEQREGKRR